MSTPHGTEPFTQRLRRALPAMAKQRWRQRELREETERIVASMPVPDPFTLPELVKNIEHVRRRRIHLLALPDHLLGTSVCGLWIKHRESPVDLILYAKSPSPWHERQIILHELVHLWADDADGVTGEQMGKLMGGLSEAMLQRLVGTGKVAARRRYDSHREQRTEEAAALIHSRALSARTITDPTARRLADDLLYPFGSPHAPRGIETP
ncbi:hypothetical protein ACFYXL_22785 [Streptomyces tsukubensis]|uniref:hypothetical protein n=1 Tax=Streptomyces tsukubensis TaxID=83656 RepID=UPI0036816C85